MTEGEEQIVRELKEIRELLVEILQSVKQVDEDICGWTAYPYLEEVRQILE